MTHTHKVNAGCFPSCPAHYSRVEAAPYDAAVEALERIASWNTGTQPETVEAARAALARLRETVPERDPHYFVNGVCPTCHYSDRHARLRETVPA